MFLLRGLTFWVPVFLTLLVLFLVPDLLVGFRFSCGTAEELYQIVEKKELILHHEQTSEIYPPL